MSRRNSVEIRQNESFQRRGQKASRSSWGIPNFKRSHEPEKEILAAEDGLGRNDELDWIPAKSPEGPRTPQLPPSLYKPFPNDKEQHHQIGGGADRKNIKSDGGASEIKKLSLHDADSADNMTSPDPRLFLSNKRAADTHNEERASKSRPITADPGLRGSCGNQPIHNTALSGYQTSPHDHESSSSPRQIRSPANHNMSTSDQPFTSNRTPPRPSNEKLVFPAPSPSSDDTEEGDTSLVRQPETRAITQDQLVNEVKGIYAGLVMVEKKCVEIDQQQSRTTTKLSTEQWQALIALHRTLLHEHHDFFLASQHPSASPALRRLASKYAMPARMWRHGIHSFLELLRHRLPDSLDHMLAFVYLSYSMMALLMESVPSFLETWIECLGDLARYRMAIEEADLRDREIWSGVAKMWYNKAADESPNVGRIQHHLAVLARPNVVQQLYYYSKALVSVVPFYDARESVMLLFTPFLEDVDVASQKHALVEVAFVKANGTLFTNGSLNRYISLMEQFVTGLESHIARTSAKFRVQGPELVSSMIASALYFGDERSALLRCFNKLIIESKKATKETGVSLETSTTDLKTHVEPPEQIAQLQETLRDRNALITQYWASVNELVVEKSQMIQFIAQDSSTKEAAFSDVKDPSIFACQVLGKATCVVSQRIGDKNILPYMHVYLAFLLSLTRVRGALEHVEAHIPWDRLAVFLSTLGRSGVVDAHVEGLELPKSLSGTRRQLPQDFVMRGLIWAQYYLPTGFFGSQVVDEDERTLELPSRAAPRTERCLYIGVQSAACEHLVGVEMIEVNTTREAHGQQAYVAAPGSRPAPGNWLALNHRYERTTSTLASVTQVTGHAPILGRPKHGRPLNCVLRLWFFIFGFAQLLCAQPVGMELIKQLSSTAHTPVYCSTVQSLETSQASQISSPLWWFLAWACCAGGLGSLSWLTNELSRSERITSMQFSAVVAGIPLVILGNDDASLPLRFFVATTNTGTLWLLRRSILSGHDRTLRSMLAVPLSGLGVSCWFYFLMRSAGLGGGLPGAILLVLLSACECFADLSEEAAQQDRIIVDEEDRILPDGHRVDAITGEVLTVTHAHRLQPRDRVCRYNRNAMLNCLQWLSNRPLRRTTESVSDSNQQRRRATSGRHGRNHRDVAAAE